MVAARACGLAWRLARATRDAAVVSRFQLIMRALIECPVAPFVRRSGVRWRVPDIKLLLDTAEECLRENAARLGLEVTIIRKERAVGFVRTTEGRFGYEVLEEVALAVQVSPFLLSSLPGCALFHACCSEPSSDCRVLLSLAAMPRVSRGFSVTSLSAPVRRDCVVCGVFELQDKLKDFTVPHCAFNGGKDVWVDVGNKSLGIRALQVCPAVGAARCRSAGCTWMCLLFLQKFKGPKPEECLHIGDRFTKTGKRVRFTLGACAVLTSRGMSVVCCSGNDIRAREISNTLWVSNPKETEFICKSVLVFACLRVLRASCPRHGVFIARCLLPLALAASRGC